MHTHPLLRRRDCLHALPRDPHTLLVYWELDGAKGRRARSLALGQPLRWVLRLTGPAGTRDLRVAVGDGRAYVPVDANASYQVSIGLAGQGPFLVVAEAPTVATPRSMPAPQGKPVWLPARGTDAAGRAMVPARPFDVEAYVSALDAAYGYLRHSPS